MSTTITKKITVNSSPEDAFKVISDFKKYLQFLPEMRSVKVDKAGSKKTTVTFVISLMMDVSMTLEMRLTPPKKIEWTLVRGDMIKHNNGSWSIKVLSQKKCELTYHVDMGFGLLVPVSMAEKLIESNMESMLKNFKKRIEKGA